MKTNQINTLIETNSVRDRFLREQGGDPRSFRHLLTIRNFKAIDNCIYFEYLGEFFGEPQSLYKQWVFNCSFQLDGNELTIKAAHGIFSESLGTRVYTTISRPNNKGYKTIGNRVPNVSKFKKAKGEK